MHTTSEITLRFSLLPFFFFSFWEVFRRAREPSVLMRSKILTAHCICNSVRNEVGANSGWKGGIAFLLMLIPLYLSAIQHSEEIDGQYRS